MMAERLVRELLTSGAADDGVVHAFYPTAERTLCNRPVPPTKKGWAVVPTCAVCVTTARAFHKIDGSCPPNWHGLKVLEERGQEPAAATTRTRSEARPFLGNAQPPSRSSSTWRVTEKERILDAIRAWAATHDGRPPRVNDWPRATDEHPNFSLVIRAFGKWRAAIEAAGLDPDYWSARSRTPRRAVPEREAVVEAARATGATSRSETAAQVVAARFTSIRADIDQMERELLDALEEQAA